MHFNGEICRKGRTDFSNQCNSVEGFSHLSCSRLTNKPYFDQMTASIAPHAWGRLVSRQLVTFFCKDVTCKFVPYLYESVSVGESVHIWKPFPKKTQEPTTPPSVGHEKEACDRKPFILNFKTRPKLDRCHTVLPSQDCNSIRPGNSIVLSHALTMVFSRGHLWDELVL